MKAAVLAKLVGGSRIVALLLGMVTAGTSAADQKSIEAAIQRSEQLIVVSAPGWDATEGTLTLFEREASGSWQRASPDVPVMLGRNGLAWGIGLHSERATKREGDGRAPAGVFELARVYGRDAQQPSARFPYQQLTATTEGIDDSRSRHYNRIVDAAQVRTPDWTRSEKLRPSNRLFRWLVEVKHNWEQRPEFGSCIYLHIRDAPGVATSGCTAMEEPALERVVRWLDARKRPLLVQLPVSEYRKLKVIERAN